MSAYKLMIQTIAFITVFMITSCSGKGSVVLQDTTCEAPCWRKIEIGKTGIAETLQLLGQMPDVDPNSIRQGKNPQTLVEAASASFINDKESSLRIIFQNDKVVSIYFSYAEDVSLANAIKKFGTPTCIYPFAIKGDPTVYLTVNLLYPDLGICLHHQNKGLVLEMPKAYKLVGSTNISRIYYVDPSLPQGQITYGCLSGSAESEIVLHRQEWNGFVEYPLR